MVFLGIFHARQDNTGSPTKPRLFGSIQSIFKTTQSYAGDETTDRLLPAPKQRSQHWLKCCGSWRSWGSRRRAPAAGAEPQQQPPTQCPAPGAAETPVQGQGRHRRDHAGTTGTPGQSQGRCWGGQCCSCKNRPEHHGFAEEGAGAACLGAQHARSQHAQREGRRLWQVAAGLISSQVNCLRVRDEA